VLRRPCWRSDDILLHALGTVEAQESQGYGVVVYLQPTTPFVQPGEINACVEKVRCGEAACCFTAREVSEPPWWMVRQDAAGHARLLLQGSIEGDREHSQKFESVYFPSGAVWALDTKALRAQHRIYCEPLHLLLMPYERSIDIDDETDWIVAETLARHYKFNIVPEPGPRL
jgi:CMP-N,N'-diacetyllegionaminic acid synthase